MENNDETEYVLFTSESVGEGHPGDLVIYRFDMVWLRSQLIILFCNCKSYNKNKITYQ